MCGFLSNMFGGPSRGERTEAAQGSKLESLYTADFATNYGEQQAVLADLNNMLNDLRMGKTGQGMSAEEQAALRTAVTERVGQNYGKAQQALNNALAARGGGNVYLPTGGEDQLRAVLGSEAARTMSQEDLAITARNYDLGRQNFLNAISGKEALARLYDPTAYGALAQKQNDQNFGQQKYIHQEEKQAAGRLFGAITGVASAFIPGGAAFKAISGGLSNLDRTGGSSFGEQIKNFFSGMGGGTTGDAPGSKGPADSESSTPLPAGAGF